MKLYELFMIAAAILLVAGLIMTIVKFFTNEGFYIDTPPMPGNVQLTGSVQLNGTLQPAQSTLSTDTAPSAPIMQRMKGQQLTAVQPTPITQIGALGAHPISTQQVTDMTGTHAISSVQNGVVSTDSIPAPIAPITGSFSSMNSPIMGSTSCKSSSMDSCGGCGGCGSSDCSNMEGFYNF